MWQRKTNIYRDHAWTLIKKGFHLLGLTLSYLNLVEFSAHADHRERIRLGHLRPELLVEDLDRLVPDVVLGRDPPQVGADEAARLAVECDHARLGKLQRGGRDELVALRAEVRVFCDLLPSQT